jgi:hypothetical protein
MKATTLESRRDNLGGMVVAFRMANPTQVSPITGRHRSFDRLFLWDLIKRTGMWKLRAANAEIALCLLRFNTQKPFSQKSPDRSQSSEEIHP